VARRGPDRDRDVLERDPPRVLGVVTDPGRGRHRRAADQGREHAPDIARLRGTSETTIRQQAQSIYRKAALRGRAELAAYFLDAVFEAHAPAPEAQASG
jgi:hypothetical protein